MGGRRRRGRHTPVDTQRSVFFSEHIFYYLLVEDFLEMLLDESELFFDALVCGAIGLCHRGLMFLTGKL